MHFIKGKSIIKRVISGILTCSIAFSSVATTVSADSGGIITTAKDDFIAGTGITITVDEHGNVISTSNSSDTTVIGSSSADNKPTEDVSDSSSPSSSKSDVEEPNTTTEKPTKFDRYFSLIDENLIQTEMLFIQATNSDVFTENTNIVSNYDNVYIVAYDSVEEARYAYSYYVDKVEYISDLSNAIVLASNKQSRNTAPVKNAITNLNAISTNDYSGYIALIDTGADGADVSLSVLGDNGIDYDGHGTEMLEFIKAENPNAKVLSIKAFEDHTTNAANLYAGIKLAIESNVSVINLSLAGYDIEKNAIIKDVIQEALDKGITVIGAAGNYNVSATKFIPGCIDGVITIGAINEDKTKYYNSNFDADVYVVATSTSEATARYTGMLTADKIDEKRTTTKLANAEEFETPPSSGEGGKGPTGTHSDKIAA